MKVERNCDNHPERAASSFCVKCGKAICPECERPYAGRPYCAPCEKAHKKEKKRAEGSKRRAEIGAGIAGVASAARSAAADGATPKAPAAIPNELLRAAAFALDVAAVLLLSIPLALILRAASMQWMSDIGGMGYPVSVYLSVLTVATAYFIGFHWRGGATLGKMLFDLRVKAIGTGAPVGIAGAFWRWTGMLAALIWGVVGVAIMSRVVIWGKYFTESLTIAQAAIIFVFGAACMVLFCSGLLITFVGKYKRGFHDLLGGTVVEREIKQKRRTESESET